MKIVLILSLFRCAFPVTTYYEGGSWDSYIGNIVAQTKDASWIAHCDRAAIIGLEDGAPWTTKGHGNALKLIEDEGKNIAECFRLKNFSDFMSNGVTAEGINYKFLREEDSKLVLAKKRGYGSLTLQASTTAIFIGHTPQGRLQGNTNRGVAVIAEYLESKGM